MSDVNGLKPGAPVRVGGVEVGTVTKVELRRGAAGAWSRSTCGSTAACRTASPPRARPPSASLGLLGEKAVDITAATEGTPIEDGGYVSAAAEDPFKGLLTDASESTAHLRRILSRMDAGEGLIGKALRDEELYDRMTDVAIRLQAVMGKLESDRGTARPADERPGDVPEPRASAAGHRGGRRPRRVRAGALGALSKDEELVRRPQGRRRQPQRRRGQAQRRARAPPARCSRTTALYQRLDALSAAPRHAWPRAWRRGRAAWPSC